MDLAILICTVITTVAAVVALLPSFGFDLRIRRGSNSGEAGATGLAGKKIKLVWIALILAVASAGLSSFAAYHFFKPRFTEKIVEKTVEKPVPNECPITIAAAPKHTSKNVLRSPSPRPSTSPIQIVPPEQKIGSQSCPNGICIGGDNSGTATVNNFGPPPMEIRFSTESATSTVPEFPYETKVKISTSTSYSPVSLAIVCDVSVRPEVTFDFGSNGEALLSPGSGIGEDDRIAWVRFGGTAISEESPLYVHLWSKQPLHVMKVLQVRLRQRPS